MGEKPPSRILGRGSDFYSFFFFSSGGVIFFIKKSKIDSYHNYHISYLEKKKIIFFFHALHGRGYLLVLQIEKDFVKILNSLYSSFYLFSFGIHFIGS